MEEDVERESAGEPACVLDRVCEECGGLGTHRAGCAGEG